MQNPAMKTRQEKAHEPCADTRHYEQRKSLRHNHAECVTAGQALGQKNTVFAIWMAYPFMTPDVNDIPAAGCTSGTIAGTMIAVTMLMSMV